MKVLYEDVGERMTKEEIIHIATNLYDETFWANSYWKLLQQIHDQVGDYCDEIDVSPCFYNLIHNALLKSMLMELAKLYDADGISLNDLLTAIKPENLQNEVITLLGETIVKHRVNCFDSWYFKNEIKDLKQRGLLQQDQGYPLLEMSYNHYYEYLTKQYHSIHGSIKKLREQRNNVLAHNDVGYKFDLEKINKKYPIVKDDVEKLIRYSFDLTLFVIEKLSDIKRPETSIDIQDWGRTLELVRKGLAVEDKECEGLFQILDIGNEL